MAGWSSANKFSLIGALRAAAQLIAYELPLVIAAAAVVMQAGTLSMVGIAEAQQNLWFIIPQLPGFLIFMMAAFAELQRPPFDMPVADAEIVFGPYTEYGGLRFALFILAEYAGIVVLSALTTVLFLGGWHGPFSDSIGWLWTLVKTFAVAFVVIWVRVAYPRMREDQLQRVAWQGLVPLALLQLAVTAVGVVMTA
jgi:NADH-quinone oxidoreductase subunit H